VTGPDAPNPFGELSPPYSTIVADPPWRYGQRTTPWRSTSTPSYSLMAVADIRALTVEALAAPDAHLYLWCTLPLLPAAVDVVAAWGFDYETMLTWCKDGPGLGGGFRGNTEHVLVARRGCSPYINPTCALCRGRARGVRKCNCALADWRYKDQPVACPRRAFAMEAEGTWYRAPRTAHSAKPSTFGDLIERMSPGPYLELFARSPRLGWDSWGLGYESAVAGSGVSS
jgi:N6-adenosine-specific RNA methylase IME4